MVPDRRRDRRGVIDARPSHGCECRRRIVHSLREAYRVLLALKACVLLRWKQTRQSNASCSLRARATSTVREEFLERRIATRVTGISTDSWRTSWIRNRTRVLRGPTRTTSRRTRIGVRKRTRTPTWSPRTVDSGHPGRILDPLNLSRQNVTNSSMANGNRKHHAGNARRRNDESEAARPNSLAVLRAPS